MRREVHQPPPFMTWGIVGLTLGGIFTGLAIAAAIIALGACGG